MLPVTEGMIMSVLRISVGMDRLLTGPTKHNPRGPGALAGLELLFEETVNISCGKVNDMKMLKVTKKTQKSRKRL